MRRAVKWILFGVVLPLAILAVFFVGDVRRLSGEFDARVSEYRADGLPVTWAALAAPAVAGAENMAGPLHEAHELLQGLDPELTLFLWEHDEDWPETEEERAAVRSSLEPLRPAMALIDEALTRRVLVPPYGASALDFGYVKVISDVQDAVRLIDFRARADSSTAAAAVGSVLALVDRWQGVTAIETLVRLGVRNRAIGWIRRHFFGTRALPPESGAQWTRLLREAEEDTWRALRATFVKDRVFILETVAAFRRGERPYSEHAGWLRRPMLYLDCTEALRRSDAASVFARDEPGLRASLSAPEIPGGRANHFVAHQKFVLWRALQHLAVLRLARIAMAVRLLYQGGGKIPDRLEGLAEVVGADALLDPITGGPFLWERRGDSVFVASGVSDPAYRPRPPPYEKVAADDLRRHIFDGLLGWEIR